MSKLLVASEYSDPCFYINTVINRLGNEIITGNIPRLLLITKNIGACKQILKVCKNYKIPKIVHVTCTGIGGSVVEPNVLGWLSVSTDTRNLIKDGLLDKETTILRMDPLLVTRTRQRIVLKHFNISGVTRVRTSIMDNYAHVRARYVKAGFEDVDVRFQSSYELIKDRLTELAANAREFGMTVDVCAEDIDPKTIGDNVTIKGCADLEEWNNMGYPVEEAKRKQRRLCECTAFKEDVLAGLEKGCAHKCLYCYWK